MKYTDVIEYAYQLYEHKFPFEPPGNRLILDKANYEELMKDLDYISPHGYMSQRVELMTQYGKITVELKK